jgi:hypothetical protein
MGLLIKIRALEMPEINDVGVVRWQNRSTVMRHLTTASDGAQGLSEELCWARCDTVIGLSYPLVKLA